MNLKTLFNKRRSCRRYKEDKEIKDGQVKKIIAAGACAPHASGGPRWRHTLVVDTKAKENLQKACFDQEYVGSCGVAIVVSGIETDVMLSSGHPKYLFDCAAACMCMDLMATSMGFGTCWIGHFDTDQAQEMINVTYRPSIILLIGHPKGIGE